MKKRNRYRQTAIVSLAAAMAVGTTCTAYAGQWQQDAKGWRFQMGTNTYHMNGWQWLDGNGDGISECYYFGPDGYMAAGTTTPDGYTVNADGQWVENGTVKTRDDRIAVPNGAWVQGLGANGSKWWWKNTDGSYPKNEWKWIDGNNDGVAECYYFDADGWCIMNGKTPDGFTVNANGAWVNGAVPVTRPARRGSSGGPGGGTGTSTAGKSSGGGGGGGSSHGGGSSSGGSLSGTTTKNQVIEGWKIPDGYEMDKVEVTGGSGSVLSDGTILSAGEDGTVFTVTLKKSGTDDSKKDDTSVTEPNYTIRFVCNGEQVGGEKNGYAKPNTWVEYEIPEGYKYKEMSVDSAKGSGNGTQFILYQNGAVFTVELYRLDDAAEEYCYTTRYMYNGQLIAELNGTGEPNATIYIRQFETMDGKVYVPVGNGTAGCYVAKLTKNNMVFEIETTLQEQEEKKDAKKTDASETSQNPVMPDGDKRNVDEVETKSSLIEEKIESEDIKTQLEHSESKQEENVTSEPSGEQEETNADEEKGKGEKI